MPWVITIHELEFIAVIAGVTILPMITTPCIYLERMPHFVGEYPPHIGVETGWVGSRSAFVDIHGVDIVCYIWEWEVVFT